MPWRPKRVGPLPLLSGIQLDPPAGKKTGLLDARNMEVLSGHLSTRRGLSFVAVADWGVTQPTSYAGSAEASSDTEWLYLCLLNSPAATADQWCFVEIESDQQETAEPDVLASAQWWDEDNGAWTEMDCFCVQREVFGTPLFDSNAGAVNFHWVVYFRTPDGWTNDRPAEASSGPSPGWYFRVRATDHEGAAHTLVNIVWATNFQSVVAYYNKAFLRLFDVVPFRSGPKVLCIRDISMDAALSEWTTGVVELGGLPYQSGSPDYPGGGKHQKSGSPLWDVSASQSPEMVGVYMAATDDYLVLFDRPKLIDDTAAGTPSSDEGIIIRTDKLTADGWGGADGEVQFLGLKNTEDNKTEFPETTADGTDWEDVVLRSTIDGASAAAVYNQRLFIAGKGSTSRRLIWSAPAEFWTLIPEANVHELVGGGNGDIVALVPIHRTLYVFTETAIWSVHEIDPVEGQDSAVAVSLVEATGAVGRLSVVALEGMIAFLSNDGVRVFDGQKSRRITDAVSDLFDKSSEHVMALMSSARSTAVMAWDKEEHELILSYRRVDSDNNNAALVINLDSGACMLWGEVPATSLDTQTYAASRRDWRGDGVVFDDTARRLLAIGDDGIVCTLDHGSPDIGRFGIQWSFSTHHLGMGRSKHQILTGVDLEVARDHVKSINIDVIPDGRLDRMSTMTRPVQMDGLATGDELDSFAAAGAALLNTEASYAPVVARFSSKGRNHRVRVRSVDGDEAPVRVASISVGLQES
jgi:hypothetical protein